MAAPTISDQPAPQGQPFKDYLRLLWRRKWVILLIVVVVTGGVEFLTARQAPLFQAQARVVVPPPPPAVINGIVTPQARTSDFLATESELITSPAVESLVVKRLRLKTTPHGLSHRIAVQAIPNTDIIKIGATAPTGKKAAALANAVADEYLLYRHRSDAGLLQFQVTLTNKRIAGDEAQLAQLRHQDQTNPQVVAQQNALIADITAQRNKLADLAQAVDTVKTGGSVLEAAQVPGSPVSPDKFRSGIIGLALGLLLGAGAAFLLEYFRDNLTGPEEIERIVGASVLALVPQIRHGRGKRPLLSEDDGSGPLTESLRTLRTNLLFLASTNDLKTVVVTSPAPEDGKTTIACNLAISLTQAGYRVVLIDADLRRPGVHKALGVDNGRGLTSVIRDGVPLQEAVVTPDSTTLRVLTSGPVPDHPTELLGGPRMRNILDACHQASDFVIIDSPPVVAVADPSVLSMNSDGLIMVMTQETGRRTLQQARTQLRKVGGRILGVVVNRVESTRRGYYYYDYYYPYYRYSGSENGRSEKRERKRAHAAKRSRA